MVPLTSEWFKLTRGAFLRFKLVESVGGWGDPLWPNLAEAWKDHGSVYASIHVEHLVKSIFSKHSRCLGRKIQYRWVRKVFLISCTLTSQLQHENEVWNFPPFLDTESSPTQRNERLTLSIHQSSFSLHEREDLLRQDISFSLQRLLILLLNCIQGFYCSRFYLPAFSLTNQFLFAIAF